MKDYITIDKRANAEIVVKKSRFIASVSPVANEEEAFEFINEIKSMHKEANHIVYAFVCRENNAQRYTDDREPAKTAGLPVLDVLLKGGITDACIVVTRYFGGTLLGTGGLVHAYGSAAADGIAASGKVKMIYSKIFSVKIPYTYVGKVQHTAAENSYTILNTEFGQDICMTMSISSARADELCDKITQCTFGQAVIKCTGEEFVKSNIL